MIFTSFFVLFSSIQCVIYISRKYFPIWGCECITCEILGWARCSGAGVSCSLRINRAARPVRSLSLVHASFILGEVGHG